MWPGGSHIGQKIALLWHKNATMWSYRDPHQPVFGAIGPPNCQTAHRLTARLPATDPQLPTPSYRPPTTAPAPQPDKQLQAALLSLHAGEFPRELIEEQRAEPKSMRVPNLKVKGAPKAPASLRARL